LLNRTFARLPENRIVDLSGYENGREPLRANAD